ncbi:hypothetical protein C8R43DRAFT_956989 [Mycena crocata]|nr:hypothetical protein C8R43DRAFT_956989 [Mycena crocata]
MHPPTFNRKSWHPVFRQTEASKARRRCDYPKDDWLDFDTQILAVIWMADYMDPIQVTLYPREDLRVRLSDHKPGLAAAGFEKGRLGMQVYVPDSPRDGATGGWLDCTWDTPIRVHAAGDAIMICFDDVKHLKDFQKDYRTNESLLQDSINQTVLGTFKDVILMSGPLVSGYLIFLSLTIRSLPMAVPHRTSDIKRECSVPAIVSIDVTQQSEADRVGRRNTGGARKEPELAGRLRSNRKKGANQQSIDEGQQTKSEPTATSESETTPPVPARRKRVRNKPQFAPLLDPNPPDHYWPNPTAKDFRDNHTIPRPCPMGVRTPAKKFSRRGRALCRYLASLGKSHPAIAGVYGVCHNPVTRAVHNEYHPPDDISQDDELIGAEFKAIMEAEAEEEDNSQSTITQVPAKSHITSKRRRDGSQHSSSPIYHYVVSSDDEEDAPPKRLMRYCAVRDRKHARQPRPIRGTTSPQVDPAVKKFLQTVPGYDLSGMAALFAEKGFRSLSDLENLGRLTQRERTQAMNFLFEDSDIVQTKMAMLNTAVLRLVKGSVG